MRLPALIVIAVVLAGGNARAGATTNAPDSKATSTPPALSKEVDEKAWSFSASVSTYIVPNDQEYVQPTLTADRGLLVGFSYKKMDFTTYVFNLDRDKPTWVFSVSLSF